MISITSSSCIDYLRLSMLPSISLVIHISCFFSQTYISLSLCLFPPACPLCLYIEPKKHSSLASILGAFFYPCSCLSSTIDLLFSFWRYASTFSHKMLHSGSRWMNTSAFHKAIFTLTCTTFGHPNAYPSQQPSYLPVGLKFHEVTCKKCWFGTSKEPVESHEDAEIPLSFSHAKS